MNLRNPAGPRRRTRRALLAVTLAAAALPASASASVLEDDPDAPSGLRLRANQETNTVTVRDIGGGLEVVDLRGLTERSGLCSQLNSTTARCARPARIHLFLGDRNDRATVATSVSTLVAGDSGDDTFIAASGPAASHAHYAGGSGSDAISYANADRGVNIRNDDFRNDGRVGLDRDHIQDDIEQLGGSRFNDGIVDLGSPVGRVELIGGPGDDVLRGGFGPNVTHVDMAPFDDGADTVIGDGMVVVDYSKRSRPVTATVDFNDSDDGEADDGEAGEGDQIVGRVFHVSGGEANDIIRARPGSTDAGFFDGGLGNDRLEGANGPDHLYAFQGTDTVIAGDGADTIMAGDGPSEAVGDIIGCGLGSDFASVDSTDVTSGCESRRIGRLRLAPKTVRATAGERAQLRLSWQHPQGWRKLRELKLRLNHDGLPVAEITVRPQAERLSAVGAAQLLREHTRLTRDGKTVTARLALRLTDSVAGQTLTADVMATDRRGRRQLERDAGTIRVAR